MIRMWVLGALLVLVACDESNFVERVVVMNEIDYPANVDVRGEGGGWLGLATVPAHDTREVERVIDQGDSWTFRFAYGSYEPVEIELSRRELVDADWQVEVPDELERILIDEGVPPPP